MLRCILLFLSSLPLWAWQSKTTVVEPVDVFYHKQRVKIQHIGQLAQEDEFLYVRSTRAPTILVLGHSGVVQGGIGGPGRTGFEKGGPLSMAVKGFELWSLDNTGSRIHHFVKGQHKGDFAIAEGDMPMVHMAPANSFASDGVHIVLTAPQKSGALGVVYDLTGKRLQEIGETLDLGPELSEAVASINETLWFFQGETFYAVHKFFPMVSMFNRDLKLKGQIQYSSDTVTTRLNAIHQFQSSKWMAVPNPLITDATFHNGKLYLMCNGVLHCIDAKTGEATAETVFVAGEGLSIKPGSVMNLHYLAFFGRFVYLAHPAMLWGHDLWRVPVDQL